MCSYFFFLRISSLDPPTLAAYYFPRVYSHLARLGANAISSDHSILINYIVVPGSRESSRVELSHPRNTEVSSSRIEVIRRGGISRFPEDIAYLPCGKDCRTGSPYHWHVTPFPIDYSGQVSLSKVREVKPRAWLAIGTTPISRSRESKFVKTPY